jgi:hypothetical protein
MSYSQNMLIIACSQAKTKDVGLVPAIDRYDGPAFRLLRKYKRQHHDRDFPHTVVLSAKYGLIFADEPIPYYDQRMTVDRAHQINREALERIEEISAKQHYKEIFISMSTMYELALKGLEKKLPLGTTVIKSSGPPGRKLSALYKWLYKKTPAETYAKSEKVIFRGITIEFSPDEIIAIGRNALLTDSSGSGRFQTWFVMIDNQPVSVKWLISKITGLPVSKFGGTEARHILVRLGVEVLSK